MCNKAHLVKHRELFSAFWNNVLLNLPVVSADPNPAKLTHDLTLRTINNPTEINKTIHSAKLKCWKS